MFEIFNNAYYIDLDKLVAFYGDLRTSDKEKTSVITLSYGNSDDDYNTDSKDLSLRAKEMVESKSNFNTILQNAKADTIKLFLDALFTIYYDNDGSPISSLDPDSVPFQQRLAFNTLLNAGILKKIKEE